MTIRQNRALPQAAEFPVELWVNDKKISTFLCSPYDLEDLGIGHLLVRGIISSVSEIDSIYIDTNCYVIRISTKDKNIGENPLYSVSEMILSGCSAVSEFSENVFLLSPAASDYSVSLSHLSGLGNLMVDNAKLYKETGGVHAALLEANGCHFLREDIGRHNAVDKAVGAAARAGADFLHSCLVTTGRISLDMSLKAASVSIPVIGTLKYPSDLGVRLASHYNICIAACITSGNPLVYTAEEKICN